MQPQIPAEFIAFQDAVAGRFSIERELGRGGMGIVLLARDAVLDRLVAIKLLPEGVAADHTARDRFLTEARTAAGLSHPNIVPIHAVEELGDFVFFVMGYVDGETLRERVERKGPLTPRYAMKLMHEVAWALGYAHQRGIVHRDVKPDNIMIEQATDRAMVTDFGIAQVGRPSTLTGQIIGTARYMSPEQASGDVVDARSDLYSLAATFFYALTGRAPFEGKNMPAILAKHVSEDAPDITSYNPGVPAKLDSVIGRCLEKHRHERIQTAEELATAIGEARGREFRAPPSVRSFVRNAEISTMVLLTAAVAGGAVGSQGVSISISGPGVIGTILIVQLVLVARRLLREGYTFDDIREALLAEARVQEEEADAVLQWHWLRRLDGIWHRLWAGRFGKWFFRVAGSGIKKPTVSALPSSHATEVVLGNAVVEAFQALAPAERTQVSDVPKVVERLERRAEELRRRGETGENLTETVSALEKLRIALLRLESGQGSIQDLTLYLERAKAIGERVDRQLSARAEVDELLRKDG